MIEQYIVSRLDTIGNLNSKSYPVAAPVGDEALPICLYRRTSGDILRDLSGEPLLYKDVFRMDLLGDDMDVLCTLEHAVINTLSEQNVDAGDVYIYSGVAAPGTEDGFDLPTDTLWRSVTYTVTYWR